MWTTTTVSRRFGTNYPLVQGPFGGGLSTPELTAAVSNAGGLGSFGANNLSPDQILQVARQIRGLTDKPFALNLWVSNHDAALATFDRAAFTAHLAPLLPLFAALKIDPPNIRKAALAQGRADLIAMWAGQSTRLLRHRTATALLAALVEETDAVLGSLHYE